MVLLVISIACTRDDESIIAPDPTGSEIISNQDDFTSNARKGGVFSYAEPPDTSP